MSFTAAIVGLAPRGFDHAVALADLDGVSLGGVAEFAESRRGRAQAELGVLRDPRDDVHVFFNGRGIPRSSVQADSRSVSLRVGRAKFSMGGDQRLALVSAGFRPSRVADTDDSRELGLPVSSIDFRPVPNGGKG